MRKKIGKILKTGWSANKIALALVISGGLMYGVNFTISNIFTNGTPISASQVNQNFADIASAVNDLRETQDRIVLAARFTNSVTDVCSMDVNNKNVPFDTVVIDKYSAYNSTLHEFTVPVAGFYKVRANLEETYSQISCDKDGLNCVTSQITEPVNLEFVIAGKLYTIGNDGTNETRITKNEELMFYLNAGDKIKTQFNIYGDNIFADSNCATKNFTPKRGYLIINKLAD